MSTPIIWETPEQMLDDFNEFLAEQAPHTVTGLVKVRRLRDGVDKKGVHSRDDYEWTLEEREHVTFQEVVSIIQFAAYKRIHKSTIYDNYSKGDFASAYKQIKAVCEGYAETQLYAKDHPVGVIFALKNNHEWVDKNETELSGGLTNRNELSPEAAAILAKASRANDEITDTPNPD